MKIGKEHTIKTDICIIGGGIIGSIVASEVAEKGFNVMVLEVLNNKAPFNLNSKNIRIDQQANNFGIGGNEKIWSQLASFIDQEEWKFYSNKYNIELEYDELLELEKKAQLYGFCDLKTLKSSPEREPNSLTKFKKYVKRKGLYCYSDLIKNRGNISIVECKIRQVDIENSHNRIQIIDSNNNELKIKFKKMVLASGGIGNYYFVNKFLNKYIKVKNEGEIKLHSKFYLGYYSADDKNKLNQMFGWKSANGLNYFYGIVNRPDDISGNYNEDMYQFLPVRWFENAHYLYIKTVLWHKTFKELVELFKDLYSTYKLKIFYSPTLLKIVKSVIFGLPSIFIFIISKVLKIKWKSSKYLLLYHHSNTGTIFYNKLSDSVWIDSNIESHDIHKIKEKLEKKLIGSGLVNIKEFSNFNIQDANHFNGALACNIDRSMSEVFSGSLDYNNTIFSVGTSNIPFSTNINPTFLAICSAFLTIDRVTK